MIAGKLYDGVTAHPHEVQVTVEDGHIDLVQEGGWRDSVDASLLKRRDAPAGKLRLGRTDQPGWRLLLPADAEPDLAGLLGRQERYGRWIDRIGLMPALVVGATITVSVVGVGYLAPHWVAPHIPMSWERNLGTAIVGDFGELKCRNPEGQKALEALVEKVSPGATKGPDAIKVAALDVDVFNAAALPGGYIVVFKPAITEADPDALAGILAHEVGHVRHRHVTEALIREFGIGALIRLFAGGVGANANQIVSLSYTRDNEAQADDDAIVALERADISPKSTADLFHRLSKETGEDAAYTSEFLQSHPLSEKRAQRFAATFNPKAHYRPALSAAQWQALSEICGPAEAPGKRPDVKQP